MYYSVPLTNITASCNNHKQRNHRVNSVPNVISEPSTAVAAASRYNSGPDTGTGTCSVGSERDRAGTTTRRHNHTLPPASHLQRQAPRLAAAAAAYSDEETYRRVSTALPILHC